MFSKLSRSSVSLLRRFFSDNAKWAMTLEQGLRQIHELNKPGLLVIHRDGCGSCQRLKKTLNESQQFAEKSKNLVCISLEGDQEPRTEKYAPDSAYVPRVLFLDTAGNVLEDIAAGNKTEFRYFYNEQDVNALLENMDQVVKLCQNKE